MGVAILVGERVAKIFIDGQVGTTGLQILDRLRKRPELSLLEIPFEDRKNLEIKKGYLNSADLVILCLPDEASRESVGMITNDHVKVIDASTAFRTDPDWVYGIPELHPQQRDKIAGSRFVANPGCYASGFLLAIAPLIRAGIVPADYPVTIQAVSGYSGGGRQLIERYESQAKDHPEALWVYRPYGLNLAHKHLPEMQKFAGLVHPPVFMPSVAHIETGMLVTVPLVVRMLKPGTTPESIHEILMETYQQEALVDVFPLNDFDQLDRGFLSLSECNGTNRLELFVFGHNDHLQITARLDNLGKGASGAAVQNLNIMLGIEESTGLV